MNDIELRRFLQQLVAGITGINPIFVRPRWQEEPPNQPAFHESWAAVGEIRRTRDPFATVLHSSDPGNFDNSSDMVVRNEILEVLASFYGPEAEANSELFAMGLMLPQNRATMQENGYGLVEVSDGLAVPALIKERWMRGIDVSFTVRRQQIYTYPSPNIVAVKIDLSAVETAAEGYGEGEFGEEGFGSYPGNVDVEISVSAGFGDAGFGDGGEGGFPDGAD